MPVDKRVVAGGGAAALLIAVFVFSGGEAHAAEEPKPRALTPKQRAIALAVRYARLFGVPPSLVLALMAVGGWREKGHVSNARGGAHGYTFMTLATARDLTARFPAQARKYWPHFNGSAESLMDPETNIALGAFQLSLQWKKFHDWLTAGLSYYTGAGRMATLVRQGGGRLPASLPADVARQAAAYQRVRTSDPYVKKALAQDHGTAGVGADGAPNKRPHKGTLANAKVLAEDFKTRDQCRAALGEAAKTLNRAYPVADQTPFIAAWAGLKKALHDRIDQVNRYAMDVYKKVDAGGDPPTLKLRQETALVVLQAGDVFGDVDEAVNDPELRFLPNFLGAIRTILEGAGTVVKAVMPSWAPWAAAGLGGAALLVIAAKK